MAINHRYLEGRKVKYIYKKIRQNGVVVGVDRNIGITIVDEKDPKDKLICLNGPSTQSYKDKGIKLRDYNMAFNKVVECIVCGCCDATDDSIDTLYLGRGRYGNGGMASCPYSGE